MDSVARQLGMDPAEFRQKNVPGRGEPPVKGALPLDTDFGELTKQAAGAIGWDGRSATDAERRAALAGPSPVVKGRSLVLSLRQGSMGRGVAYAMATIDGRGRSKFTTTPR